jgi:3-phosphoshikimate 1-carboxyvinyltransferase
MPEIAISQARELRGSASVPGDKSIAHRALLLGALAGGWTRIAGVPRNADVSATIRALNDCGVQTQRNDEAVVVHGAGPQSWLADGKTVDCANSGTTMRLLMGILAGMPASVRLVGDASLSKRPMRRIAEPLERMGAQIALCGNGVAPVDIRGSRDLRGIDYTLQVPSAQIKTALLLAGLTANGGTRLRGRLDSRDHTERMLPRFGAALDVRGGSIEMAGGQRLRGVFVEVPGDPSSAAFWIAAALVTPRSRIEVRDVCLNPTRTGFIEVLRRMGASIETRARRSEPEPVGTVIAETSQLRSITLLEHEVPSLIDELPLLAVLATQAQGTTVVRGAAELRVKESDRIEAIAAALRAIGAQIETFDDGFVISGRQELRGGTVDPCGDHRIAMAASIAALCASGETVIRDAECVGVSYPSFFATLRSLGGQTR